MTACRDHWQANLAAALAGEHPEGIHQVRVGLRRFRTALTLFRDHVPPQQYQWLKTEAKALSDLLGPARDLDVFVNELAAPIVATAGSDPKVAVMLRNLRAARAAAHGRAVAALGAKRYRRFVTRLQTWLAGRGWRTARAKAPEMSARTFARALVNGRMEKIQRRAKAIESATPDVLHALRIDIKKLRYGLEFFESLLPNRRAQRIGRLLKALQDSLGHLNDIDVAGRTIATLSEQARDVAAREAIADAGTKVAARFKILTKTAVPEAARVASRLRAEKAF